MNRVFFLDFPSGIDSLPGGKQFLDLLRDCRVSPFYTRSSSADLATLTSNCEIVGFAGDDNSTIEFAAAAAKSGGVVFAFGYGLVASWCDEGAIKLERDAWLRCKDFRTAIGLRAFQQRIGGG